MTNSQERDNLIIEIDNLKKKLSDLNSDYNTLQECKQLLAKSSVFSNDLITQCEDISRIFDRKTIEGRYDSHQITFKSKELVFEYLDNIVSFTNNFKSSCSDIVDQIDTYGVMLDNRCIDIATEAHNVSNQISTLNAQLTYLQKSKVENTELGG